MNDGFTRGECDESLYESGEQGGAHAIETLLKEMAPQRPQLMTILEVCRSPQTVGQVEAALEDVQRSNLSVYSTADFCALLETAGALKRIEGQPQDGASLSKEEQSEDDAGEQTEDGAHEALLQTTSDAEEVLRSMDAATQIAALFERDAKYLPIYEWILRLTSIEEGASLASLSKEIDGDPLLKNPHLYTSHFVHELEEVGALMWDKTWHATNAGKRFASSDEA